MRLATNVQKHPPRNQGSPPAQTAGSRRLRVPGKILLFVFALTASLAAQIPQCLHVYPHLAAANVWHLDAGAPRPSGEKPSRRSS